MNRGDEFVLAQTNLQLYRQLIEAGWSDAALGAIRESYDLVRELFVGCYRPSQKCFSAHLVGTASALAAWGEPQEMVIAGMLHSAYLFGEFGDATRGSSKKKRQLLRERIGVEAEEIIERYTHSDPMLLESPDAAGSDREVSVLRLADLCDECIDAGARYSPLKPLALGLPDDASGRPPLLSLAEKLVGPVAAENFRSVFAQHDRLKAPAALVVEDRAFHTVRAGAKGYPRSQRFPWIDGLAKAWKKRMP